MRPGGRLVVEDYDWTTFGVDPPDAVSDRVGAGVLGFMSAAGFDPLYGRRVVSDLSARGLEDVRGEGRSLAVDDASPGFAFFRLSFDAMRPGAVAAGHIDAAEAEEVAARMDRGGVRFLTPVLMAAVGRRPG